MINENYKLIQWHKINHDHICEFTVWQPFSILVFSKRVYLFETIVDYLLIGKPMGHAWLSLQCEKHLLKHVGWVWPQRRNTQD